MRNISPSIQASVTARAFIFTMTTERVVVQCATTGAYDAVLDTLRDEMHRSGEDETAARWTISFVEGAIACGATHVTLTREPLQ